MLMNRGLAFDSIAISTIIPSDLFPMDRNDDPNVGRSVKIFLIRQDLCKGMRRALRCVVFLRVFQLYNMQFRASCNLIFSSGWNTRDYDNFLFLISHFQKNKVSMDGDTNYVGHERA